MGTSQESADSICLLHGGIAASAEKLIQRTARGPVHIWDLTCLSMLVEAACLYDRIVIYHPHPIRQIEWLLSDHLFLREDWITFRDSYPTFEELAATSKSFQKRERFDFGMMMGAEFLDFPAGTYLRNQGTIENLPESVFATSIAAMGKPSGGDILQFANPDHRLNFHRMFAASRIWQLEAARDLRKAVGAAGLILPPTLAPFWQWERNELQSALHTRVGTAEQAMLASITADAGPPVDVSPLTIVALDTTLEVEMLWDTIRQMRRDYADLRVAARRYTALLASADQYGEIAELISDWRSAWDTILRKLAKPSKSVVQRMFAWDVLKKGTFRGMLLEAADIAGKEWKDVTIERGFTLVRHLQSELFFARPMARRIEELFGGPVET